MKTAIKTIAVLVSLCGATTLRAQSPAVASQPKPAVQVFEHYEAVRVALSNDRFADVAAHAKQLAATVEPVGRAAAKKAAEALVAATTIEDARNHFGDLSTILVPVFQAEKVPGATAYICPMKQQPWVQRGDAVENPYYGKAMLTCGSPLPAKK